MPLELGMRMQVQRPQVRDHRTEQPQRPQVRDHRTPNPQVRDHRAPPPQAQICDHRAQPQQLLDSNTIATWMQTAQAFGIPPEVAGPALINFIALALYRNAIMQAMSMNPMLQQPSWLNQPNLFPQIDPDLSAQLGAVRAGANSPRPRVRDHRSHGPASSGSRQPEVRDHRTHGPANTTPVRTSPLPNGPADTKLAAIQSSTVDFAQRELDNRVTLAKNPDRVQQYAKAGGMDGGAWCGYFTGFQYEQAAKAQGGHFNKDAIQKFHSMEKARAYFEYSNYTKETNDDGLRTKHQAEGSARKWMVLEGSHGDKHAKANHRPSEVYEKPSELPIRKGDTVLFSFGHVGIVKDFDPTTGKLTTIEGNAGGGKVKEITRNLNDPKARALIEGFGRPAMGDFTVAGEEKKAAA